MLHLNVRHQSCHPTEGPSPCYRYSNHFDYQGYMMMCFRTILPKLHVGVVFANTAFLASKLLVAGDNLTD